MLYISRYVDVFVYGVVDTDDDTETLVTGEQLRHLVVERKLHVEGVTVMDSFGGKFIHHVTPYQDMRYYTPKQAKLQALSGVELHTWRDDVTFMRFDLGKVVRGMRIRLSDYGSRMYSGLPIRCVNTGTAGIKDLILVLDDNITLYPEAPTPFVAGVCWDISEHRNIKIAEAIYDALRGQGVKPQYWDQYVIDNPRRSRMWR